MRESRRIGSGEVWDAKCTSVLNWRCRNCGPTEGSVAHRSGRAHPRGPNGRRNPPRSPISEAKAREMINDLRRRGEVKDHFREALEAERRKPHEAHPQRAENAQAIRASRTTTQSAMTQIRRDRPGGGSVRSICSDWMSRDRSRIEVGSLYPVAVRDRNRLVPRPSLHPVMHLTDIPGRTNAGRSYTEASFSFPRSSRLGRTSRGGSAGVTPR